MSRALPRLAPVLLLATACVGEIGGDPGGAVPPPDGTATVAPSDLRRLTRHELELTLRDLFGDAVDAIATAMDSLPTDSVKHGFSTMSRGVTSANVDGWFGVADALSKVVASDPKRVAALEPCLASPAWDDVCFAKFLGGFGRRAYRRPLTADEKTTLASIASDAKAISSDDAIAFTLFAMLQSAPFLYRPQIAGAPIEGAADTFALTDWELASRLSYFAWGSAPDDALLDAAARGELVTDPGRDAAIDRLFAGPRATRNVERFFDEWLETDLIPKADQRDKFLQGIPKDTLADDMREELRRLVDHEVFETPSTFADLMTSDVSFVTSAPLAQLYGVSLPAGDGELTFTDGRRSGLLTRAGLLLASGESTHPVKRGAFVRRKLLCDPIQPPDPTKFPPNTIAPPPPDSSKTARERWTAKTSQPLCKDCHGRINPFGFALEHYDAIGRWRDTEPVINDITGKILSELPIDVGVDIEIEPGTLTHVSGAAELGAALAASPTANRCFSAQVLRFVEGRTETADDAPVLDAMTKPGASVRDTLIAIAKSPAFRVRRVAK